MIKIKDLVEILKNKDQSQEVECIIIGTNGAVEVLMLEKTASDFTKILSLFKSSK